ncbi:4Fe-4S binding protein [Archaeoglobus sulfaticallidus]|uniref:4Fe-4S binding protein n=1 Tax=Archaeoglobus sulfaticallidus TaxID=1316941 RepID=UPI000A69B021|nr:4Fe-4S binding protein [Archaeoglobus sulfaticallidus]
MKCLAVKDIEKCVGCGLCVYACSRKFAKNPELLDRCWALVTEVDCSGYTQG